MAVLEEVTDTIYPIEGKVQHYDWGGRKFIPDLLGENNTNLHYAEYWLGAHGNAPSILTTQNGKIPLDLYLHQNLTESLGVSVASLYGTLPYLFKVLDVEKMLSIQVHPSRDSAERGFERENKIGISLTAKNRNYKDTNHKPEIMVALSEFWLLHGFLEPKKLIHNLENTKELRFLLNSFGSNDYFELYKKVMEFTQEEVNDILHPLVQRILPKFLNNELHKNSPDYWAAKAVDNQTLHIDRGLFSIYFFNILKVSEGEAIFQGAGLPHTYLEGKNMELMANSDNVLRGGLTRKHIDIEELLNNIKFEETIPTILNGTQNKDNAEVVYKTNAKDFELCKIKLSPSETHHSTSTSVEILIALEGAATIIENSKQITLNKGKSVLIVANTSYKITTPKGVVIYRARVPKSE
jgi:mannose-6-phosphate isomerase